MTTLIGIVTNSGRRGVVLGADRQVNYVDENDNLKSKCPGAKITVGSKYAMAAAGVYYDEVTAFMKLHKSYDERNEKKRVEMLRRAVRAKVPYMPQINELNRGLMRNDGVDVDDLPTFLLALNDPMPKLWSIDEFGNLRVAPDDKKFEYITRGSGDEMASKYIDEKVKHEYVDPQKITLCTAIDIAFKTLMYVGSREAFTGSTPHIVVITKSGVDDYYKEIARSRKRADKQCLDGIKSHYEKNMKK